MCIIYSSYIQHLIHKTQGKTDSWGSTIVSEARHRWQQSMALVGSQLPESAGSGWVALKLLTCRARKWIGIHTAHKFAHRSLQLGPPCTVSEHTERRGQDWRRTELAQQGLPTTHQLPDTAAQLPDPGHNLYTWTVQKMHLYGRWSHLSRGGDSSLGSPSCWPLGLAKRACLEPMPSGAGTQQSRPSSVIRGMQGFLLCDSG